jgi:cell division protein FtsL
MKLSSLFYRRQYEAVLCCSGTGVVQMQGKEVTKIMKKLLVFLLAFAVVMAFSLPSLAQDKVEGKIESLNKAAKKITINGIEYSLSDKAAKVEIRVGDLVVATVEGNVVKKLARLM